MLFSIPWLQLSYPFDARDFHRYGGPQLSRQQEKVHGEKEKLKMKEKRSQLKKKTSREKKKSWRRKERAHSKSQSCSFAQEYEES